MSELTYTRFDRGDADDVARWVASERWPYHGIEQPTFEQVHALIEGGGYDGDSTRTFLVREPGNDDPVAIVRLQDLADATPIFDLRVRASARGRGVGRAVLLWLTRYVFTETDKHRIEGHTRADNLAMRRVFDVCGWTLEAHYRSSWPDGRGAFLDSVSFGILRREWESGVRESIDWRQVTATGLATPSRLEPMSLHPPIPILRTFDDAVAHAFYVDFLGFAVDWEHRFEPSLPLYQQVSRAGCRLHLSGHHGDACPGAAVRIETDSLDELHKELRARPFGGVNPRIDQTSWGTRELAVRDPFGNRLVFWEPVGE